MADINDAHAASERASLVRAILQSLESVLLENGAQDFARDALTKMALAGLVLTRVSHELEEKSEAEADSAWAEFLLTRMDPAARPAIGRHIDGTALQGILERHSSRHPKTSLAFDEIMSGHWDRLTSGMTEKTRAVTDQSSQSNAPMENLIGQVSDAFIRMARIPSRERSSLHGVINAMILLEEAEMMRKSPHVKDSKGLRRMALEYAMMRLLDRIGVAAGSIEEMREHWHVLGRVSRLNTSLSDALDRVESYSARAAKDTDMVEGALAAGRPGTANLASIATSARQVRLFRDRLTR